MKRRTKPNRNGGRAHGGGGNHHGGQNQSQMGTSRKGGNSAFGHEDLEILEDEPIESEDESDDEWVMDDEDEEQATVSLLLPKKCKSISRKFFLFFFVSRALLAVKNLIVTNLEKEEKLRCLFCICLINLKKW